MDFDVNLDVSFFVDFVHNFQVACCLTCSIKDCPTNHIEIPANMVGSGEHFALEIVGDSMIGVGILDGDTVLIQRAETAMHGEIVVALIDQQEATLKTLLKEPGRIGLEAANPKYETRYFSAGQVEVQGKLTGLIRNY